MRAGLCSSCLTDACKTRVGEEQSFVRGFGVRSGEESWGWQGALGSLL